MVFLRITRVLLLFSFCAVATWAIPTSSGPQPVPVSKLDVSMYLGRWYQMYASVTVQDTMELGGNCVTADYGSTNRTDVITVVNTVYPLGFKVAVSGFAVARPKVAGEFSVAEVGPVENSQYQYAIVTDPNQLSFSFDVTYKRVVFEHLEALGFDKFWNKPLKSNQMGCKRE